MSSMVDNVEEVGFNKDHISVVIVEMIEKIVN